MKRILFVATREPTYSRVSIVRNALGEHFQVDEIVSARKSYPARLLAVVLRLLWARCNGQMSRADAVVTGFFAQPVFPLIRLMYRGPIVADAYFSIYDTMVHDKRRARPGSLLARLCFWLDRYMLQHARLCLTDTQQHVEYLKSAFGAPGADVRRLWISAETPPLAAIAEIPATAEIPAADPPLEVLFWGGFIPLQGVETIVEAAALLKHDPVRITVVGAGQTLAACQDLQQRLAADRVRLVGWKPLDEIVEMARHAHLALGIFGTTDKAGRVIPNKAFEALAMGLPLVTRRSAAIDELLTDGVDAMLVEPGDPRALAERLREAGRNREEIERIGRAGQARFQQVCSPQRVAGLLGRQLRSIPELAEPVPAQPGWPHPLPAEGNLLTPERTR